MCNHKFYLKILFLSGSKDYELVASTIAEGFKISSINSTLNTNDTLPGLKAGVYYEFTVLARGLNNILNLEAAARITKQTGQFTCFYLLVPFTI